MATLDEFRTQATTEVENEKPLSKSVNGVVMEFDDDDYAQMIEDRANYYFDEQENGYIRARQFAYPDITEQLDLLFHDMTAGKGDKTGEWYKAVNKVKTDNPKPS